MSMNLFVGKIHIHCLNQIRTTALASSSTEASPPNPNPPQALAVQYLVQSCGLYSEKALKASKHIHHLKSFDKPDAVLRFLREIGVSESDIKTAVSREAIILCSHVEKNWRPNITKLQELSFSIEDISVATWKRPDVFKMQVEGVEKLGIPRSSGKFINALVAVSYQKQCTIDAKLDNLRSMGLSPEEVALLISKAPNVLALPEKLVGSNMEYLVKEAGCDKIYVLRNPFLLTYSWENRLIPWNIVRKLLMSKGLAVANHKFATFIKPSDKEFVKKYVMPYEHAIPGLHRAYADASTRKIGDVE